MYPYGSPRDKTDFFSQSIESSNYREAEIKIKKQNKKKQTKMIIIGCVVCIQETYQRDVAFMHTKHVFVI